MDQTKLADAVGQLRDMVALDGGDVELVSAAGGEVELRLILEGAECKECVMPREFLEQIALDMFGGHLGEVRAVRIHDPREAD